MPASAESAASLQIPESHRMTRHRAAAIFGIALSRRGRIKPDPASPPGRAFAPSPPSPAALAAHLLPQLLPGRLVLLTGKSGSGKSSLLRALTRAGRPRPRAIFAHSLSPRQLNRFVLELFDTALPTTLSILSRVGLAEVPLLFRRARELSAGQQGRLCIALGLSRCKVPGATKAHATQRPTLLLIDEFASTLDRPAAMALCWGISRWAAAHPHVCIIAATAHDDLPAALNPHLHVYLAPGTGILPVSANHPLHASPT